MSSVFWAWERSSVFESIEWRLFVRYGVSLYNFGIWYHALLWTLLVDIYISLTVLAFFNRLGTLSENETETLYLILEVSIKARVSCRGGIWTLKLREDNSQHNSYILGSIHMIYVTYLINLSFFLFPFSLSCHYIVLVRRCRNHQSLVGVSFPGAAFTFPQGCLTAIACHLPANQKSHAARFISPASSVCPHQNVHIPISLERIIQLAQTIHMDRVKTTWRPRSRCLASKANTLWLFHDDLDHFLLLHVP